MRDEIELRGLRCLAVVGVLDHERTSPQPLEIDLVLRADLDAATRSDALGDTVDYGAVIETVVAIVEASSDLLLERLAGRICEGVLADPRVAEVEVVVRKLRPPVPVQLADTAVRLRRAQRGESVLDGGSHRAILALGSNLGDRLANLRLAVRQLGAVVARSHVFETDPVGGPQGQDAYLNMVVALDTDLDPFALLRHGRRVERAGGRRREAHHGARTLDVDILFYDDAVIRTPELTVPHPRYAERRFVLAPLAEVAPQRCPEGWEDTLPPLAVRSLGPLDLA